MMEKLKLKYPVIVEGKYDKNTLSQIIDAPILTTGGFSLFHAAARRALLLRLSDKKGVIVLTDPDGGGKQIRSYLTSVLPKEKIINLYIPQIKGKERRKQKPSAAGFLGVEGMDASLLRELFRPFAVSCSDTDRETCTMTKADFYAAGLSGRENSSELRSAMARLLGLPGDLTPNALLEAVNLLCTREQYEKALTEAWRRVKGTEPDSAKHR